MSSKDTKRNLPTRTAGTSVDLHNAGGLKAGSLIEQSVHHLSPEQRVTLMGKAAEEALRLEVKGREQNIDYVAGKKVIEDHIETFDMLSKEGKLTRQTVESTVKTGAGNMRIESKSGATCFVASVAYADPNHPEVRFLRAYRDTVLARSIVGRRFIAWYWTHGPHLAKLVGRSRALRQIAKRAIHLVVCGLRLIVDFDEA